MYPLSINYMSTSNLLVILGFLVVVPLAWRDTIEEWLVPVETTDAEPSPCPCASPCTSPCRLDTDDDEDADDPSTPASFHRLSPTLCCYRVVVVVGWS